MKKLLIILGILFISCRKEVTPTPPVVTPIDIFTIPQNIVINGQDINFKVNLGGQYTLTMKDSLTGQVITREKLIVKTGQNKLKIYTKTLPVKYLYLILEDSTKNQIGKTTLIIN